MPPDKPDKLLLQGKVECSVCGEPHPPYLVPNGVCEGCHTIVEIDEHMGLGFFQRLEEYRYDHEWGHWNAFADPKPKTGMPHLDMHPVRFIEVGTRKLGGQRPPWMEG